MKNKVKVDYRPIWFDKGEVVEIKQRAVSLGLSMRAYLLDLSRQNNKRGGLD